MESYLPIVQFLLPEFLLENLILISVDKQEDCFQVYPEEKNFSTDNPDRANLLSKGFFPSITVQDFPIRGHKVFLHIKRRRWLNTTTGKVQQRDWNQVAQGTRMMKEFARSAAHIFLPVYTLPDLKSGVCMYIGTYICLGRCEYGLILGRLAILSLQRLNKTVVFE